MPEPPIPPGHPVDTFRRENVALGQLVDKMRQVLRELHGRPEAALFPPLLLALRQASSELANIDKHYARKENLLFSRLEKRGVAGPWKAMYLKDDEVRQLLKRTGRILAQEAITLAEVIELAETTIEPVLEDIGRMILEEEDALLPALLRALGEEDWAEVWRESPGYGWCLVQPREGYHVAAAAAAPPAAGMPADRALALGTGSLTLDQLQGILDALPVELTFVDAEDRVRYFSLGSDRVFVRSKTVLGRKVQNCHPPGSVHVVDKILSDFRAGQRSVAEFWLQFRGKFVHVRYFAVRDPQGQYLGTLEVTQDVTHIRGLQGQRRLLEYDRIC